MNVAPYAWSVYALVAVAVLTVIQLLVADFARGAAKITPGAAIEPDHSRFVFRADRTHGNSLENLPPFALLAVLAIVVQASPMWVNGATLLYLVARLGHMALYYLDVRKVRPAPFALGILATLILAGTVAVAVTM